MEKHTLTVELCTSTYHAIQRAVESGAYRSPSELIEDALLEMTPADECHPPRNGRTYEDWVRDEAIAAHAEYKANPSAVYTDDEVRAYLNEDLLLSKVG